MAKRGKFVYRGGNRTVEEIVRKSKQSGGAYDSYLQSDVQMLKIKDGGETTLRIMPPSWDEKDDEKWGRGWDIGVWLHYDVGPDRATYLCLDKMKGEVCPICEARRQGTEDERDALKPQWRALAWVIDRGDEKAGPQVWSMPPSVFREINLRSVDKKHNTPVPIDDPDNGYDITFTRDGSGLKTKYSGFEIDREPTPLHEDERIQNKWLDYISENPLPNILQFYDAEHIESVLFGRAGRDDDEDAPRERRPAGKRERPAAARGGSAADEEEDYLDDEEEEERPVTRGRARADTGEDEDDEEDDAVAARRRRGGHAEDDDVPDDDEEDAEEEEEEEERPRSRGRGGETTRRAGRDDEDADDETEEEDEEEDVDVDATRRKLDEIKRRKSRR